MISDSGTTRLLSSLGWVDHGSIWCLNVTTGEVRTVVLSDAAYLELHAGDGGRFTAVHHFEGARLRITVHPYADPGRVLAAVEVRGWTPDTSGDPASFAGLTRSYVGYLNEDATGAAGYYHVRVGADGVTVARLDWFDDQRYDHGYQGVVGVLEIPCTGELVFGVARSSDLVICDPATLGVVREVRLAGSIGNPVPRLQQGTNQLWAVDYDTVVRVDYRTWRVTGSCRAQPPIGGSGMFLGDMGFTPDQHGVIVPRPGSGDVLLLSSADMSITATFHTGDHPLEAALLPNGHVAARAWKSGDLLLGTPSAAT